MKKFWLGVLLAGFALSVTWVGGVRQQLGVPTPSSRWVFDAYQHKIAAANTVLAPRILIVAGSNAMFGIDSGQIEAYWHRPVINLAVNAGLGLPYILDASKRVARPGDVILMPMEYALYLDDGTPNAQVIDFVVGRDLNYWRQLSLIQRLSFAASMAPERWIQGLRHPTDNVVMSGTYGAHHLDLRGDQTHSSAADQTPADKAAVQATKAWNYGARSTTEIGGWHLLSQYAKWAQENKVCVIAVPTVLQYHKKYDTDPQDVLFYSSVASRVNSAGIPYVGSPRNFMYPDAWFFDTDHHLQDWARSRHTAALLAILKSDPQSYCQKN